MRHIYGFAIGALLSWVCTQPHDVVPEDLPHFLRMEGLRQNRPDYVLIGRVEWMPTFSLKDEAAEETTTICNLSGAICWTCHSTCTTGQGCSCDVWLDQSNPFVGFHFSSKFLCQPLEDRATCGPDRDTFQ